MKTKIKFLTVSVLILVSLCLNAYNIYASGFEGRHMGTVARMIGLTEAQKSAIKTAIETDPMIPTLRSQIKSAMPNLIAARKALKLDILRDLANNNPISGNFPADMAAVSAAKAPVEQIRTQIHAQVLENIQKALTGPLALTPAQIARINQLITFLSE